MLPPSTRGQLDISPAVASQPLHELNQGVALVVWRGSWNRGDSIRSDATIDSTITGFAATASLAATTGCPLPGSSLGDFHRTRLGMTTGKLPFAENVVSSTVS